MLFETAVAQTTSVSCYESTGNLLLNVNKVFLAVQKLSDENLTLGRGSIFGFFDGKAKNFRNSVHACLKYSYSGIYCEHRN